jgi:hypothetical protein
MPFILRGPFCKIEIVFFYGLLLKLYFIVSNYFYKSLINNYLWRLSKPLFSI